MFDLLRDIVVEVSIVFLVEREDVRDGKEKGAETERG